MTTTFVDPKEADGAAVQDAVTVKELAAEMMTYLNTLPASREMSLAKTKLEECVMWAVKGITG